MVTLNEVWHVPGARANLLAMWKANDAGARVCFERGVARFEKGVVVRMEAVQRDALWEIATVKKGRAFLAVKRPANVGGRTGEAARKPPVVAERKRVEVKPVKFIEVDLELDDESDDGLKQTQSVDVSVGESEAPTKMVTEVRGATKAVEARVAEAVGATVAKVVGAHMVGEVVFFMESVFARLELQSEKKVKSVQTDRSGEYVNEGLTALLGNGGTVQWTNVGDSPEQSGSVEPLNRALEERGRALLEGAKLDPKLWAEAIIIANYTRNRVPSSVPGKTP
ncbi:hypothetical protein with Ribonuclease H-like domain [Klebsormidium nitens]|uniref:Integrase catalytic domain-containing protein n=1 Tax=Klebsormidium nitens TaxID=105231 RepID=A0A1Y1ITI1_KLENI|nr:hypothetical protein with Ribonuclease H-like domain [Klebsormidium nitens]|eukprot:GAQ91957.1 hypothetical protein with Ribonuclease H-like domain [Klebsormidium nitens]